MKSDLFALIFSLTVVGFPIIYIWWYFKISQRQKLPSKIPAIANFNAKGSLKEVGELIIEQLKSDYLSCKEKETPYFTTTGALCNPPGPTRIRIDEISTGHPGRVFVAILSRKGKKVELEIRGGISRFPGERTPRKKSMNVSDVLVNALSRIEQISDIQWSEN